jgi:hypothetical protein
LTSGTEDAALGGNRARSQQFSKPNKRPTDVTGNAVHVCKITIGEIEDVEPEEVKSVPNRAKGGRAGGPARAASLSSERRKEIAQSAATTRWGKRAAAG